MFRRSLKSINFPRNKWPVWTLVEASFSHKCLWILPLSHLLRVDGRQSSGPFISGCFVCSLVYLWHLKLGSATGVRVYSHEIHTGTLKEERQKKKATGMYASHMIFSSLTVQTFQPILCTVHTSSQKQSLVGRYPQHSPTSKPHHSYLSSMALWL